MGDRLVAIVPARGGSKGIPDKNLAPLAGLPLLAWTVRQLGAAGISEVAVTTDSERIGEVAVGEGATWVHRPQELASDYATSESALVHAATELDLLQDDIVIFAQATSPLRLPADVTQCVELLGRGGVDSVFSGVQIDDICLWEGTESPVPFSYDVSRRLRRQTSPSRVVENGSLYAFRAAGLLTSHLRLHGNVAVSLMPKWTIHEVDEPSDLPICEALMRQFVIPNMRHLITGERF